MSPSTTAVTLEVVETLCSHVIGHYKMIKSDLNAAKINISPSTNKLIASVISFKSWKHLLLQ